MKNKLIFFSFFLIFSKSLLFAEEILIQAKNISLDKNSEITVFKDEVLIQTKDGDKITSDYAEYNRKKGNIKLRKKIIAYDSQNNKIETEIADYNEKTKVFISKGPTVITTAEKYIVETEDILLNNKEGKINSNKKTTIIDKDRNKIFLESFEYSKGENIFKSIGNIKIIDNKENSYEFSQIYIDTKKKEILGTDSKAYLNDESLKFNKKNKPRIFSNTIRIKDDKKIFNKSVFTICNYRKNDKCPPWSIQATSMFHDSKKKTIYYDNAVVKIYDLPLFYIPKLSHPDPTVKRRSGFLTPYLSNSKNLGSGISIPYFWAMRPDKNFTFTNKLYGSENPLFMGEFHQAFKNSNFLTDFGYTEGYKNTSSKKKAGDKSHFFSKFVKNFNFKDNAVSSLDFTTQHVSNDKYLKLYKINTNLIDDNASTLENSLNFTHETENMFFGLNASIYETLDEDYNDKYEYILPELTFEKNLFSNQEFGNLDILSSYKLHNYDTNKSSSFLINNFNWQFREFNFPSGLVGKLSGNLKNINYETKNIDIYKKDSTNELFGAIGYLTELNLIKNNNNTEHLLKPKLLFRYAPGSMRKETLGSKLTPLVAFNLDRLDEKNNFETGLSAAMGLDYNFKTNKKEFDFSIAQVVNNKENKKMSSVSSLDEELSDIVGSSRFRISDNFNLNYNFNLDQNYNEFNNNELGTIVNFENFKVDLSYLQEKKHIGDQEYFKTKFELQSKEKGLFSFETKRNLITDSAEFYNLSYEYLNDCLRAGIVYRREFYNDSEIEPENSLLFKITLTPFGNINSPSFNQ